MRTAMRYLRAGLVGFAAGNLSGSLWRGAVGGLCLLAAHWITDYLHGVDDL